MSNANLTRFHWNAHVINRLRKTTRPVWEYDPVMTPEEVGEAVRCYEANWEADSFADMLIARDEHLRLVG